MKQSLDFTEIKEFCDKVGLNCQIIDEGVIITKPKDIWDGVEFARYKYPHHLQFPFFKVKETKGEYLISENGGELFKGNCEPINEQAYIEQLKKEAHERFGEIKERDRFDRDFENYKGEGTAVSGHSTIYFKEVDEFHIGGICIYQQGKWATRVKERVKITPLHTTTEKRNNDWKIDFSFSANNRNFSLNGASTFLASQLEAYLNLDGYSVDVSGETLSIHVKIRNGVDLEDLKEKAESLAKIVKKI